MKEYRAGIDIGSTTVKLVVLDAEDHIIYGQYRRHMAKTQEAFAALLREATETIDDCALKVKITGSGSINLWSQSCPNRNAILQSCLTDT